ncbi:efflux RND transporter periplasmic adaptor subunit [Asticcacaulis sp. 201]|uniref:efflux RND transporter periplasmic adaptor subunit n=1 Tax=Asticcacaulis sp. 201 TaxID=3028787 RepID=UPI00291701AE|nr:efflux RND transporter periplasmic adaptor subunit [Asticcacaulis sp. 201]MDV6330750.1 efflux RND transporter periplasmic adaptor subunit [Asticcacaulis sp. 201]
MNRTILYISAAVLIAGGLGYGVAKWTAPKSTVSPVAQPDDDHAPETIALSDADAQKTGIDLETVQSGGLAGEILAQGTITAGPEGQAVLTARADGTVTRLYKRLGDPVKAGETVALVESREAAQILADRQSAEARADLARKTVQRERRLFDQGISPRVDYERAETEAAAAEAEARRSRTVASNTQVSGDGRSVIVTSPITGRISAATASLGAFVTPESEVFRVTNSDRLQAEVAVGAVDSGRVKAGDRATILASDGRTIEGRVRSITPALDGETRSATAILDLAGGGLQPGQSVRVRLFPEVTSSSTAIVVADQAVQTLAGKAVVFVKTPSGFTPAVVTLGQRSAGRVEIVSGLKVGDIVAVHNAFLLKAEMAKSEHGEH